MVYMSYVIFICYMVFQAFVYCDRFTKSQAHYLDLLLINRINDQAVIYEQIAGLSVRIKIQV